MTNTTHHPPALVAVAAAALLGISTGARANQRVIDWDRLDAGELHVTYLEVTRPVRLQISATATFHRESGRPVAYPWILDSRTRTVRWTVDPDDEATSVRRRGLGLRARVREDTLHLAPGQYEIYFAAYGDRYDQFANFKIWGIDKWLEKQRDRWQDDWNLVIELDDKERDHVIIGREARPSFAPLARIAHPADNTQEEVFFRVDAPVEVLVYAIGEYDHDSRLFTDGAWIAEATTRRVVWEMTRRNTRAAGGAAKNRRFRDFVELASGTYVLGWSSDDSHSYGAWNLNPPHDPEFWGVALFDPRGVAASKWNAPVEDPFSGAVVVSLDRQRNNSFASQGIRVRQPIEVRVVALGEYDESSHGYADCGWIENARTHERVWEMQPEHARPAGGDAKNHRVDNVVKLEPGDYLICYKTDGSHAYGDWNATPPRQSDAWGITVYALDHGKDLVEVIDQDTVVRPGGEGGALVTLTRIGDDRHATQTFELSEATTVRVLAIGEGLNGHMFDYGWIRRRSGADGRREPGKGALVWRMHYDDTTHAGGADKNRMVEETLWLEAGRYEAHFVTDDSHSFEGWNSAAPNSPHLWGLTLYRVE